MSSPTPPRRGLGALLRSSRPWWILPFVLLFVVVIVLILFDVSPLRSLTYSVL